MTGDRDGARSNPYRPDPAYCCERCIFGRGEHSHWCIEAGRMVTCAKCGGPMWVTAALLPFYYDCGLQHPACDT